MGNWKMNGTLAEGRAFVRQLCTLLEGSSNVDVCLCPPFTLLQEIRDQIGLTAIFLGAQNVHHADKGAFTGEVSIPMLQELDCTYVILGHSERRSYVGETDAMIARKILAAQSWGITPVLCVGESLEVRDNGEGERHVLAQVRNCLDGAQAEPLVIAYEPIWAIGTGRAASTAQAAQMLKAIREALVSMYKDAGASVRLLYGGSVTAANISEYLASEYANGALVGGASLQAEEFASIVRQAETVPCITK
ncbi:MAG: triosephosphate isomerase (TIM) [Bacillota bacterium]|nr:MAG: triosephosphate isomerase (TIM) [Bacillota bacterium]